MYEVLSRINHPHDIKSLSKEELELLCAEIRQEITDVVNRNGVSLLYTA